MPKKLKVWKVNAVPCGVLRSLTWTACTPTKDINCTLHCKTEGFTESHFFCTAQKSLISRAQYSIYFYFIGEVGGELLCAINKSFQQESLVGKCCTMWSFKKSHVSAHQQKISTALCTAKQNASKEPHFFFISVYGRMWEWYIWNWWVWVSWKAFNFSLGFSFKMSSLVHWITEIV